jgi:hypothetical protein
MKNWLKQSQNEFKNRAQNFNYLLNETEKDYYL